MELHPTPMKPAPTMSHIFETCPMRTRPRLPTMHMDRLATMMADGLSLMAANMERPRVRATHPKKSEVIPAPSWRVKPAIV